MTMALFFTIIVCNFNILVKMATFHAYNKEWVKKMCSTDPIVCSLVNRKTTRRM